MCRRILLSLAAGTLAGCGDDNGAALQPDAGSRLDAGTSTTTGVTTYYVVRHTERDPGQDPPINAEGRERAERLADALERAGVDEIVTTEFIRGQQSAQPLSERTGAPIVVAPAPPQSWPQFAEDVVAWQRAREVVGRTYLFVGHSGGYNSTLLRGLGMTFEGTRGERYQDLVLVIREANGAIQSAALEYGGPSTLDP